MEGVVAKATVSDEVAWTIKEERCKGVFEQSSVPSYPAMIACYPPSFFWYCYLVFLIT